MNDYGIHISERFNKELETREKIARQNFFSIIHNPQIFGIQNVPTCLNLTFYSCMFAHLHTYMMTSELTGVECVFLISI